MINEKAASVGNEACSRQVLSLYEGELFLTKPSNTDLERPVVSVIVTAYNHRPYIRQCLNSIFSQKTNFPFEVLINDDASDDGTREIIEEFERKYPDNAVCLYWQKNQYSKRDSSFRGGKLRLSLARGDYISRCEGDDFFVGEDKIQRQYEVLSRGEYVASIHSAMRVDEKGESLHSLRTPTIKKEVQDTSDMLCNIGGLYALNSLMYRADIEMDWELRRHFPVGDIYYALYLSSRGKFHYDDRVMSAYRVASSGSWSQRMSKDVTAQIAYEEKLVKALKYFDEYTDKKYHERVEEVIFNSERMAMVARRDPRAIIATIKDPMDARRPARYRLRALLSVIRRVLIKR